MKIRFAPSIVCADFLKLGEQALELEAAGAEVFHFDIMDEHFVPNLTFGHVVLEHLRPIVKVQFDAHLMVQEPQDIIDRMARAGADMISVHVEACTHLQRTLAHIRSLGAKAGVALNPATPLDSIEYVLDDLDYILIMSVNPGFSGQRFVPAAKKKVADLAEMLCAQERDIVIEMDGNITPENLGELAQAGARLFVTGTGLFENYPSIKEGLQTYRRAAEAFEKQ